MEEGNLLFVYGTLKGGFSNHYVLHGARFMGDAVTEPKYDLFQRGIPFMVRGTEQVQGEVWLVSDEMLARLDRLEGHPNMYRREPIEVYGNDGAMMVQAYLYQWDLMGAIEVYTVTDRGALVWTDRRE